MGHLDDGALRRMIDEPLAMSERDRRHFEGCAQCRASQDAIGAGAAAVAGLFTEPTPEVDARAALASVRRRADALPPTGFVPRVVAPARFQLSRHSRPLVIAGLAAVLVAAMTVTGTAGDAVSSAVTLLKGGGQVTAVPVQTETLSKSDIAGLPDLSGYGTMTVDKKPETTSVDAVAKAAAVGIVALNPGTEYGAPTYTFISQSQGTFRFDAAKAAATAAAHGKSAPVFTAGIDRSTLTVSGGPALVQVYGKLDPNSKVLPVVVASSKAPVVTSSGVSVKQLEDFLTQQPGITAAMASAIRSIGDPIAAGNLPIPVPAQYAKSEPFKVGEVNVGVIVKDNTGLASALIWQKGDTVYAIAGHLDSNQLTGLYHSING